MADLQTHRTCVVALSDGPWHSRMLRPFVRSVIFESPRLFGREDIVSNIGPEIFGGKEPQSRGLYSPS
jgi:hypothetical protein